MGGSAPPPKTDRPSKRKKSVEEIERRSRYSLIRNYLLQIETCLELWDKAPRFNKEEIKRLLLLIEKEAHKLGMEAENGLINRTMILGYEIEKRGVTQKALLFYDELYKGYRLCYDKERKDWWEEGKKPRASSPLKLEALKTLATIKTHWANLVSCVVYYDDNPSSNRKKIKQLIEAVIADCRSCKFERFGQSMEERLSNKLHILMTKIKLAKIDEAKVLLGGIEKELGKSREILDSLDVLEKRIMREEGLKPRASSPLTPKEQEEKYKKYIVQEPNIGRLNKIWLTIMPHWTIAPELEAEEGLHEIHLIKLDLSKIPSLPFLGKDLYLRALHNVMPKLVELEDMFNQEIENAKAEEIYGIDKVEGESFISKEEIEEKLAEVIVELEAL